MYRLPGRGHVNGTTAVIVIAIIGIGFAAAAATDRSPGWSRAAKMTASTLVFVVFAQGGPDITSPSIEWYAVFVMLALAASWIGDLCLSIEGRTAFVAGLGSFALAHLLYSIGFVTRASLSVPWLIAGAALMSVVGVAVLRWLTPHRPPEMRIPLAFYVLVIGVMTTLAFATHGAEPDLRIPIAALVFAASDILVARQQFVARSLTNRLVGLPMYYAAQILFALSAAAGAAGILTT